MNRWLLASTSDSSSKSPSWLTPLYGTLIVLVFAAVCVGFLMNASREWQWGAVWEYKELFWRGWITTVIVSVCSLIGSLIMGGILAALQICPVIPLRVGSNLFVEFFRGTPLLVQIMFFFYVVADRVGVENRYVVGVSVLSLYAGTYIAEIIRGGVMASGKSQMLAAMSVGMTTWQSYRHVIVPQAIRSILPSLAGQLVALIKHSSLLSVIAVEEFTYAARSVNSITFSTLESYMPLLFGYLILTLVVSRISAWMERRWRYET